jgi:hypothetical protein
MNRPRIAGSQITGSLKQVLGPNPALDRAAATVGLRTSSLKTADPKSILHFAGPREVWPILFFLGHCCEVLWRLWDDGR